MTKANTQAERVNVMLDYLRALPAGQRQRVRDEYIKGCLQHGLPRADIAKIIAVAPKRFDYSLPAPKTRKPSAMAYHEAGHFVVADRYRLEPFAHIRPHAWLFDGITNYIRNVTPYQNAVINWAGLLAEYMAKRNGKISLRSAFVDCEATIKRKASKYKGNDWLAVSAYPDTWRTFKTAASILRADFDKVKTVAAHLMTGKTVRGR